MKEATKRAAGGKSRWNVRQSVSLIRNEKRVNLIRSIEPTEKPGGAHAKLSKNYFQGHFQKKNPVRLVETARNPRKLGITQ